MLKPAGYTDHRRSFQQPPLSSTDLEDLGGLAEANPPPTKEDEAEVVDRSRYHQYLVYLLIYFRPRKIEDSLVSNCITGTYFLAINKIN